MKWISVKDELPPNGELVIVCGYYWSGPTCASWSSEKKRFRPDTDFISGPDYDVDYMYIEPNSIAPNPVTHWMPLPTPPVTEVERSEDK